MENIKYTYIVGGQNQYMRIAIDAIGSELEPVLAESDWQESSEPTKPGTDP